MSDARKHFERAVQLRTAGAWTEALAAFHSCLKDDPTHIDAAIGVARLREERGQWSYATEAWQAVLDLVPEHREAATARAESLRQAGCFHRAQHAYDIALRLNPNDLLALAGKAECLRVSGDPDAALEWFDRALSQAPDHTLAVRGKAAALNALGRFGPAIVLWEQAAALDPESAVATQGLAEARDGQAAGRRVILPRPTDPGRVRAESHRKWGRALAADSRAEEAAEAFERSLVDFPNDEEGLADLARVYERMRRFEQAVATYGRLLGVAGDQPDLLVARADALRQASRFDEAVTDYDRALALRSDHVRAMTGRADALRQQRRYDEAVDWYSRALRVRPTHVVALRGKASALNELERWADAASVWKHALAIEPTAQAAVVGLKRAEAALAGEPSVGGSSTDATDARAGARDRARGPYEQGRSLMQQGRFSEAATELRHATEEDPDWTSAWYLLGLAHSEGRQFRAAIRAFDEVLQREPGHLDAACHRADELRHSNDFLTAIGAYDQIIVQRPEEVRATAGRAEALRMLGRFQEALDGFERTLVLRPRHYLALCGRAATLNSLRRFDEALPLWLAALRENRNAMFVKRGLAQCRGGLGEASADRASESLSRRGGSPSVPPRRDEPVLPSVAPAMSLSGPRSRTDRVRARDELDRGRILSKERKFSQAIVHFEAALRYDDSYADAALRLGLAYEEDKQLDKAVAAYERCLVIDPAHFHAATNIGEAFRKNERYEEAIDAYDRALKLKQDYLYAIAGRAECMRMLGDLPGCLVWFDRALEVGAQHAFAIQGKAAALNTLQRYREAIPLWNKALEIEPDSQFAREGKGFCEQNLQPDASEEEGESLTPTLDEQGRDLTDLSRSGKLSPVIGRSDEIRSVMKTLVRRLKANPLLLGDPGVGKTAIVEGVAQALTAENAPERLRNLRLIELSMGSLLAGTKYRGTFEERLKDIIREARETPGIVLFIDEIHTLVGAGRTEGGSLDAANILKPALARGEITVIGATTVAEYRKHFETDSALERRFQPISVEEPSLEEAVELLNRIKHLYEEHHQVSITLDALDACVRLSVRFVPERRLPDKALDLLDEACADVSLGAEPHLVDGQRVARIVSERTNVPVHDLTAAERERLNTLEGFLRARVIGQEDAVAELASAVRLARSGLRSPLRPRGVFLFAGSSGVGKTELARALTDFLFPEGNALVKLDMSEYGDRFTSSRLLGAPPGYQGHGEEGQLTGPLRRRPYAVVLLDEFEKAHPDVQAMFLSLFDEGVVTDAEGRKIHACEAFFILTTNAGSEASGRGRLGFGGNDAASRKSAVLAKARDRFRPELLNRLDGVVVFRDVEASDLVKIVDIHLTRLQERAALAGIALTWSEEVAELCSTYQPASSVGGTGMGARPALRAIDELVAEPLGDSMLRTGQRRRALHATVRDGRVEFEESIPAGDQEVSPSGQHQVGQN